jgi:hypothetical protein
MNAGRDPGTRLGAKVSATVQRWPSRNHFREIAPGSLDAPHPVDRFLEREPRLRKIARRARRLLSKIQDQAKPADLLEFEAESTLLDASRVEVAFNLGFENGLVLGRAEGMRRGAQFQRDRDERVLLLDLRAVLAKTQASPARTAALLLELAWAFTVGAGGDIATEGPAPLRPGRGRRGPSRRSARRPGRRRARPAPGRSGI